MPSFTPVIAIVVISGVSFGPESGFVTGAVTMLIYGGIMNPASCLMWNRTGEAGSLLLYYIAGLPMDLVHATSSFVFLWFFGEPLLAKLDRVKKNGF